MSIPKIPVRTPRALNFPADMAEFVTAIETLGRLFPEFAELKAGENMIPTVTVPIVGDRDEFGDMILGYDTLQWNGLTWVKDTPREEYVSPAPAYEVPDWEQLGFHQQIVCGKRGVRREQDSRHAAWIRREAKKRGLVANVQLGNGIASVRLTRP